MLTDVKEGMSTISKFKSRETPLVCKLDLPNSLDKGAIKRAAAAYSKVFRPRVRPLKVGIRWDLIEAGAPPKAIAAALEQYTCTREYYLSCRNGRKRHDIRGFQVGTVTAADQKHADRCLEILDQIEGGRYKF